MSKYVLDSCVALKWVLPEPDSDKALALRDQYVKQVHELLAPDVFPVEVAHALAKAERKNLIQPPVGTEKLTDVLAILPPLRASLRLLPRAFEIASNARIGVYDCLYVSLAEQEQYELVTSDKKLINALQQQFPFIIDLASLS